MRETDPVLPFLVYFELLLARISFLGFLIVFPFFSRDFRGSVGMKSPFFWWVFPAFFQKNKERKDRGFLYTSCAVLSRNDFWLQNVWACDPDGLLENRFEPSAENMKRNRSGNGSRPESRKKIAQK